MKASTHTLLTLALLVAMIVPTGIPATSHRVLGGGFARAADAPSSPGLNTPSVDIRVNAGGPDYTDSQGNLWQADKAYAAGSWGYTGGTSYTASLTVTNTSDPILYQSQRTNPGQYKFDVPNDVYEAELRFAEIYCTNDCRTFHVRIEGQQVLTNFGPFKYVGFRSALNTTFLVPVTDHQLNIEFVTVLGQPVINAIRVTSLTGSPPRNQVRLNAGGFDYIDSQGNLWVSDQAYIQGTRGYQERSGGVSGTYMTTSPISNTVDQPLFQVHRYDMGGYAFDLDNGFYRVDLLLAETYPSVNATGARVFDVYAEGQKVLSNVDVFTEAGSRRNWAITKTFDISVLDSQLNITFTKGVSSSQPPIVNAIAVRSIDELPPGPWANFTPTDWAASQTPAVSVQVRDSQSGLNVATAQYAYSTNGGATYSAWLPATATGSSGSTVTQTVSVAAVPFNQDSATQNKVKFRISDMAGNQSESPVYTVQIDTLPPLSTITSPPAGSAGASTSLVVQGITNDAASGVQSVEVSTNGGSSWNPATGTTSWSYTTNLPGDGIYTIRARSRDPLGHVETPGPSITYTVDSVPPVTFIRAPVSGQTITGTSFLITGTAYDAGSGIQRVELSFDAGASWVTATGTTSWSYDWTPSRQGNFTIQARAVDRAGNADSPGTAVNVIVDRIAPTATISDPTNGRVIRGSSYTISGLAADDPGGTGLSSVEVSTDGSTWHTASGLAVWLYHWDPLPPDGAYTVRSRARDLAGNTQNPPYSVDVYVDNAPPVTSVAFDGTAGAGGWYISPVTMTLVSSDAASGVKAIYYRIDAGDWLTYTAPTVIGASGSHTISYYAVDQGGNAENPRTRTLLVDTAAPVTTASYSGPVGTDGWYRGPVDVTLAATDVGSGVQGVSYNLDGVGWQTYSNPFTISGNSTHWLLYRATDIAGNNENIHSQSLPIDGLAPTAIITFPVNGQVIASAMVRVQGSATDSGGSGLARVEVSINGGAWQAASGSAPWTYMWVPSGQGMQNLRVRATDSAGNMSDPGSGIYVTIDTTPPSSTIVTPYNGQVVKGPVVVITGTAADTYSSIDHVDVSTDGGLTWGRATMTGAAAWTFSWTVPNDGIYTLRSRAVDSAGNIEIVGPGISVQVDSIGPSSVIMDPVDGQYIHASFYPITGTASDIGSGVKRVEVSIDNGPWNLASGTTGWQYVWSPIGGDGPHTIRSRATDFAGNVETPSRVVTVNVDNSKPTSTIDTPISGQIVTSPTLYIAGRASDAVTAVRRVEISMQRSIDGYYWNGSQWTSDEAWLPTGGTPTEWNYLWTDVPVVAMVTLRSRATDNVGNVEVPAAGTTVIFRRGYTVNLPVIMSELHQ